MSKGKRRRSLPSLFNPFNLFGMGNANNNQTISGNPPTRDDEKSVTNGNNKDINNNNSDHNLYSSSSLKNNTQIQYLQGHQNIVNCLCKIDENRFASCSDDKLILIWDINNGLLLDVLCGHKSSIKSLILIKYKQYKLLLSASFDHTIRIWNVTDSSIPSQCISILTQHNSPIIKILHYQKTNKLKHDGIISAANDGSIAVWSINDSFQFDHDNDDNNNIPSFPQKQLFILQRIINVTEGGKHSKRKRDNDDTESSTSRSSASSPRGNNNNIDIPQITKILFLNTNTVKQLIIGCMNGSIIFINFDKNDRIKIISKHNKCIKYIYQSSIDRFITASYDGLICIWRIEPTFPQLLERINYVEEGISSWSKSPKSSPNRKSKKSNKKNTSNDGEPTKPELITEAKDLRLNEVIDFIDEYGDKYFIVSFSNSFVIFDSKFLVKSIVKNCYIDNTEIIAMTIYGNKSNLILITANNKHIIKLWNICKINLKSIETGVWLSCFRQELLYNLNDFNNSKKYKKNKSKNMVTDLCIDCNDLLINTFKFHSDKIISIKTLNNYTFISCDKMNQIILWKDAYHVSYLQNQSIKEHFNLPSYN